MINAVKRAILNLQPERFFVVCALLLGFLYNLYTPPMPVPDEIDHLRRAYHVADGHFLPEKEGKRLGGQTPGSFKQFFLPFHFACTNYKYTIGPEEYHDAYKAKLN